MGQVSPPKHFGFSTSLSLNHLSTLVLHSSTLYSVVTTLPLNYLISLLYIGLICITVLDGFAHLLVMLFY